MAEQEQEQAQPEEDDGREGARWINRKPTSAQFGAWFDKNVSIAQGLEAGDYIGGIVLIPALSTGVKRVKSVQNGVPVIDEISELAYIPYAKVETRVKYFWDLMQVNSERWIGVIEPVEQRTPPTGSDGMRALADSLPKGFSVVSVPWTQNNQPVFSHYVVANYHVAVYERDNYADVIAGKPSLPIRQGFGTKQVPLSRKYPDDDALMKAETGAIGRALGVAGIFVIPGSGVATAEDMLEGAGAAPTAAQAPGEGAQGPVLPPAAEAPKTAPEQVEETRESLVKKLAETVQELQEFPAGVTQWTEFLQQRQLRRIEDAADPVLKGLVKKAEKILEDHKQHREQNPSPEQVEPEQPTREMVPGGE